MIRRIPDPRKEQYSPDSMNRCVCCKDSRDATGIQNLFQRALLTGLYGFRRAGVGTCSTISAEVRVNGILVVTLADSLNRTLIDARSTTNTFISDNICHCCSPFLVSCMGGIENTDKWQVFFLYFDRGHGMPLYHDRRRMIHTHARPAAPCER